MISICHLYRVGLAEERVDQMMFKEKKGNIIAELVRLTALPEQYVDEKDEFLQYVTDIVNKYKQNQVEG